jgi:hypothetical protein
LFRAWKWTHDGKENLATLRECVILTTSAKKYDES